MPEQRRNHRDRVIEIDAVLEHLRQVKADTLRMILALQKERGLKKPKSNRARKRR